MLRYWIISAILLTRVITGLTQPAEFPAFRVISPPEGFTYSAVITITEDPFGLIWFGTQHGLYFYDTENIRKYLHKSNDPNSPAGNHIRHLFCDSSGKMWISTPTGLCYYDFRKERFVQCRYTD